MIAWWQSLTVSEHVLLYIAVPATLILLIQTVLLFAGGLFDGGDAGDGDMDAGTDFDSDFDTDFDGDLDADALDGDISDAGADPGAGLDSGANQGSAIAGLHLFSIRGIVAFFTLFGWSSLCFLQIGFPTPLAVLLGVPVGLTGMVCIAIILREALKLQYDGTLNIQNAVGLSGTVYLTIPALRTAPGKVNVTVQEQLREFEAVTDRTIPIPTGSSIRVVGLTKDNLLLVEAYGAPEDGIDWCDMALKMKDGFKS